MKKLTPAESTKIIESLGGTSQVVRLLENAVSAPAVSYWKKAGMSIANASALKLKSSRNAIWKEVRI